MDNFLIVYHGLLYLEPPRLKTHYILILYPASNIAVLNSQIPVCQWGYVQY